MDTKKTQLQLHNSIITCSKAENTEPMIMMIQKIDPSPAIHKITHHSMFNMFA